MTGYAGVLPIKRMPVTSKVMSSGWASQLSKKINILARLYLVDAITSIQDGKRFRIDFNYAF
jgi:hypothetical protein